jgi:hypothetical protein
VISDDHELDGWREIVTGGTMGVGEAAAARPRDGGPGEGLT